MLQHAPEDQGDGNMRVGAMLGLPHTTTKTTISLSNIWKRGFY